MTQDQLYLEGVDTAPRMFCGLPALGLETGKCKNVQCTRRGHNSLDGYCPTCAASCGCNALKACGLQAIRLEPGKTGSK